MFTRLPILLVFASFVSPLFADDVDISRIGRIQGAAVTLHPGEQILNGQVIIPETVSLVRGSEGSVLKFVGLEQGTGECLRTLVRDHAELTLRDFTLVGDHDGTPIGLERELLSGIGIRKVERLTIINVSVRNVAGMGINISGCRRILVRNCTISDVGRDGVTSYGRAISKMSGGEWVDNGDPDNRLIEELQILENTITNTGDDAIACWLSSGDFYTYHARNRNITIADNRILGASEVHPHNIGRGIAIGGAENVVIRDNVIQQMPIHGIHVGVDSTARNILKRPARSSEDVLIENNVIEETGLYQGEDYLAKQSAIYLEALQNVAVIGNRVSGVYVNRTKPGESGQGVRWIETETIDLRDNEIQRTGLPYPEREE